MELNNASQQGRKLDQILLFIGVIIIAFNLRPAITSVGPLIAIIRDDLGLANWSAGLLTSLPLIAFAVMSPVAPSLGNRLTNERAMLMGMGLLLVGISIRSVSVILMVFLGTFLIGIGIAVLNVLLPSLIKDKFPNRVGLMTSVYSTAMGIIAATATGLSVPLASGLGLGWQFALIIWVTPAIIGILIWIYLSKKKNTDYQIESRFIQTINSNVWHSPLAWQIALFMGFQSFLFYVTISWLPQILHDSGVSMATAGWMLSFAQFIGLPASFLVPVIAEKFKSQRGIVLVLSIFSIGGYSGLLFGKSYALTVISIILIGIALAGKFALALAFLGLRTQTARQAAQLSGMAQTLGYILAAIGPIFIGYLFDLTGSWTIPIITIIIVACFVTLFGFGAGRNKFV
ncbi:CynX/NimT family MFS transporter [Oceanobacillus saliphilus]|uniref:CynX/NimT family MFS transporter n=1 Tax=Oceanobacillus saliphilus TaxID=2925834 RepID=UPI00201E0711